MSQSAAAPRTTFGGNLRALRAAQKPSRGTAAYSRYVNRPSGRLVAAAAHTVGLSPDGATAISATMSGAGIALLCLAEPSLPMSVAVAVLLAGGYVMDSVDGQLARLRGRGSVRGEWLDHTVDCFKTASLHLAVAVSWFRFPPDDARAWLLVPLGFSVVQAVTYFGLIIMPFLRKQAAPATSAAASAASGSSPGSSTAAPAPENPLRTWLILPTDYGFLCWVFVLLAWGQVFLVAYTLVFALAAAMLGLALAKWWRELSALDRARLG